MEAHIQELVVKHIPLVKYKAKQLASPLAEYDDLVQEGCIELIRVAQNWDGERKFAAYAGVCIRGAMLHYMRDKSFSVKQRRGEQKKVISLNTPVHRNDTDSDRGELLDTLVSPPVEGCAHEGVSYDHVLKRLSLKQLWLFNKHFIEKRSIYELAKEKRVGPSYLLRQLRAIREKFRIYL